MMLDYRTIAETNNFIVLDKYTKCSQVCEGYQTEYDLEGELIQDLKNQGYEHLANLNTPEKMLANVRVQLQNLNKVEFSETEWVRFCEQYLDKPSDNHIDKTRKIHTDYIYDLVFDDGHIENIYLVDKKTLANNKLQVISQFEQKGNNANRYDVTILVNGLPLVQIELKKRGIAIREAFNQCIVIARKVLIQPIHYLNICKFSLFLMVLIAVILQILLNVIRTVLILR